MTRGTELQLYPIRFRETYRKKVWGGDGFKKILKKKGCPPKTGESLELIQQGKETSVVAAGPLKGMTLTRLLKTWPREILGDDQSMRFSQAFPVTVKFLNTRDRLSLQVHPSDEFAQRYEIAGTGKTEMWYILSAGKEGKVIRGVLPGTTIAEFKRHLAEGSIETCLNVMDAKEGDIIFIPPGTLHSASGDVVMLEIQQNSEITYRLHDWNRPDLNGKPRRLDVEKAMGMIDFYSMGVSKYRPSRISGYSYKRKLLIKCEKFTAEMIELEKRRIAIKGDRDRFHIL
ncbi:MAG: hypothetical protein A2Z34_01190, partial [Planctomycetes bacterium RBG_16_59_8]